MKAAIPLVLFATACTSTVSTEPPRCAELVAASGLLEPTPPPELPEGSTVGDWQVGFIAAIGALDAANLGKAGAKRLGETCERLHRDALKRATRRRFLGL